MHLELVELLRCPVSHAPGVLVASADTIANRYVTDGLLGCSVCYAEYAIRSGVTHFVPGASERDLLESPVNLTRGEQTGEDSVDAMRLAAQLGLRAGRGVFALVGYDITTMIAMREIVAARVLMLNPMPLGDAACSTEQLQNASLVAPVGVATCGAVLPLVPAKFDGIAVQAAHASPGTVEQAATALRSGGRLVVDARATLPGGVRELVRDKHVWVAERESVPSAPIAILRR